MIFFDTNFIVNLLVETEFTEKVKKIVMDFAEEDFFTSITVIEETF